MVQRRSFSRRLRAATTRRARNRASRKAGVGRTLLRPFFASATRSRRRRRSQGARSPRSARNRGFSLATRPISLILLAFAIGIAGLMQSSCQSQQGPAVQGLASRLDNIKREPAVRVRIARGATQVVITSPGAITVEAVSPKNNWRDQPRRGELTFIARGKELLLRRVDGKTLAWPRGVAIRLTAQGFEGASPITYNGRTYPGAIMLHTRVGEDGSGSGIDVVNHLPMEQYIPGVIAKELYAHWHPETFRAQAIAARSYAIATQSRTSRRYYDLENTQASQVYIGTTTNPRAIDAVRATRGVVLGYDEKVLTAFYSACSGGTAQDVSIAFPNGKSIPPLAAKDHGAWGSASPAYRWGPIKRDRRELAQRLSAWGQARGHRIGRLRTVEDIRVTRANRYGRPAEFTVYSGTKRFPYVIACESFRMACNYSPAGVRKLDRKEKLLSSHVTPRIDGTHVVFEDGRGHGHGVGMDQWGAQAMATQGYRAQQILGFYYPGAELVQAYR